MNLVAQSSQARSVILTFGLVELLRHQGLYILRRPDPSLKGDEAPSRQPAQNRKDGQESTGYGYLSQYPRAPGDAAQGFLPQLSVLSNTRLETCWSENGRMGKRGTACHNNDVTKQDAG